MTAAENQLATAAANLAKLVVKQFGVAEAKVAAIQGDQVYLNVGQKQFIKIGTIYEILAEGTPVIDPSNRSKIGTLETHVAEIKIATVRDSMAIGQVTEKSATIPLKVGQKAVEKPKMLVDSRSTI